MTVMNGVAMNTYRAGTSDYELSREELAQKLLEEAQSSRNGTARVCFHQSDSDEIHLMLIAIARGRTFPLHMHEQKTEFLVYVAGSGVIEISRGQSVDTVPFDMASKGSGVVLIPKYTWHSVTAGSDGLVLFEATQGPFLPSDTIFRES